MKLMDKALIKELLLTGDIFNTINGGRIKATTQLKREEEEEHYVLELHAPGISVDSIQVQIEDDQLLIMHVLDHENSEQHIQVPFLIDQIEIPFDVNITAIHAKLDDDEVNIILPFNELANGFKKNIDLF